MSNHPLADPAKLREWLSMRCRHCGFSKGCEYCRRIVACTDLLESQAREIAELRMQLKMRALDVDHRDDGLDDDSWMTREDALSHYQAAMLNWSHVLDQRDEVQSQLAAANSARNQEHTERVFAEVERDSLMEALAVAVAERDDLAKRLEEISGIYLARHLESKESTILDAIGRALNRETPR